MKVGPLKHLPALLVFLVLVALIVDLWRVRADTSLIERVKQSELPHLPHASVEEITQRAFAHPRWEEKSGADGREQVVVSGNMPVKLTIQVSSETEKVSSVRLEIAGTKLPDTAAGVFLSTIYSTLYPDSVQLLGRWVSDEVFQRLLYLRPDGTFHMHAWPWDFGGDYAVDDKQSKILLRPNPPLVPAVKVTELEYSITDDNHIRIRDPDADLLLASHPVVFKRE